MRNGLQWKERSVLAVATSLLFGANHILLNQASENYKRIGVCKEGFESMVRKPLFIEFPKNN
ncbi:CPCC family cysteine-rich protein [Paenibacillus sp. MMS20-IR301]|uniref:CPCC family cysteine-rich protein n=1 Tax=Paenibacillus sp. MMS20-IR301 TaxID=2895946 RepID=UPI0028E7D18C|nr:CPCC family cysteine-rich protein [Paenibacillus sp. MMS20-IR301]WNS45870.1 CPCC family cysteine-rich protein [Paenibacillus sp. MMS20-IR301]